MKKNAKMIGITLAASAALVFASVPVTSAFAADTGVQCFGINGCKGQGSCKTANNSCKGQNSCKGKGLIMQPTADDCTKAGGTVS